MITVKNDRVVSFSREYFDIYWEIEPTTEDIQEYAFYVERSEAEGGPWDVIAGPLIDRYYVRDNSVFTITAHRVYFYRIRVLHLPSGREYTTGEIDRAGKEDLIASEIVRRERVLYEEFVGVKCWVFPRRTFGQRCPQCYDDVLGKRTQESCPLCFGSTFSGGYHYPVEFFAQIDDPGDAEQVFMEDHRQTRVFGLRMNPSPAIRPMDLLIDHQNRRFRIVSVEGTTRLGVAVRQEAKMVEIQKGSIEDRVPLRIDPAVTVLVSQRNFTNPQNPDSADPSVDTDSWFSLYGY